jgi:hypothetical protein
MDVMNKLIDTDEALVNQFNSNTKHDIGTSGVTTDPSSKLLQAALRGAGTSYFDVQRRRVQCGAR